MIGKPQALCGGGGHFRLVVVGVPGGQVGLIGHAARVRIYPRSDHRTADVGGVVSDRLIRIVDLGYSAGQFDVRGSRAADFPHPERPAVSGQVESGAAARVHLVGADRDRGNGVGRRIVFEHSGIVETVERGLHAVAG